MHASTPLNHLPPDAVEAVERLAERFSMLPGFDLAFIFISDSTLASALRERLEVLLRVRGARLQLLTPVSADVAESQILAAIDEPDPALKTIHAPAWVDLHRERLDPAWQEARSALLLALNRRRGHLQSTFARPLILLLPQGYQPEVWRLAADLWTIRGFSQGFDTPLPVPADAVVSASERPLLLHPITSAPFVSHDDDPLLAEWCRLQQRLQSGEIQAEQLDTSWLQAVTQRALNLQALEVVAASLGCLQQRLPPEGGEASASDVITVGLAGELAVALGDWYKAETYYAKALTWSKQRQHRLGTTPEVLRELSVSENKLGGVARALGHWEEAGQRYRASLGYRQQIQVLVGDTPAVLRDLSVSESKLGEVAQALRRWDEAGQCYRASLGYIQQIQTLMSDTPEVLRDLSVLEIKLGEVAQAQGRWEEAGERYRASLGYAEQVQMLVGDTPAVLRDLSVSEDRLGNVVRALDRWDEAGQRYLASHGYRQKIQMLVGDTPEVLRDLSVSEERLGNVAQALGHWDEAWRRYRTSLGYRQQIQVLVGDTPDVLDGLAIAHYKLASLAAGIATPQVQEGWAAHLAAAEALWQQLQDTVGAVNDYPRKLAAVAELRRHIEAGGEPRPPSTELT